MAAKKEQAEVLYLEIVDRKNSGFIMEGTEGTLYQQELNAPTVQWIPASGKACKRDEKNIRHDIEVRFISGCDSILPLEQEARGFRPNRFEDKIPFENGFATAVREGAGIGLYDYLKNAYWFKDNPDRPSTATPLYRELKLDKKAVELLDDDQLMTEAKGRVYSLRLNTGNKIAPYKYDHNKIDAMCRLLEVWDETPERKLVLLLQRATGNPKSFLEIVEKAEQTIITEVTHALQLDVIKIKDNTVLDGQSGNIIRSFGDEKLKQEQKIEKLADWFATAEGNPILTDMRIKLEIAKEQSLQK